MTTKDAVLRSVLIYRLPQQNQANSLKLADMSDDSSKFNRLKPYIAALCGNVGGFILGLSIGWSAPATEIMGTNMKCNELCKSWAAGSLAMGAAFSIYPVTYASDRYGPKATMLSITIPLSVGWIIIAFSKNLAMTILGRAITGFCSASYIVTAFAYIKGTVDKNFLLFQEKLFFIFLVFGILVSSALGLLHSIRWMCVFSSCVCTMFVILIYAIPESPVFLAKKWKLKEAEKSLRWFQGNLNPGVEFKRLKKLVVKERRIEEMTLFKALSTKAAKKAMLVLAGLTLCDQLSGISVILGYSVFILKSSANELSAFESSVVIASAHLIAIMIAIPVIQKSKPDVLLILSYYLMGFSLFGLGTCAAIWKGDISKTSGYEWLALLMICVYLLAYNLGCGYTTFKAVDRMFPDNIRREARSLGNCLNWLVTLLVTQTFPGLQKAIGLHWAIWIYGVLCFAATAFVFIFVVGKLDKMPEEIEVEMKGLPTEHFLEEEVTFM